MGTPLETKIGTIFTTVWQVMAERCNSQRGGFNTEYNPKNTFLPFFEKLKQPERK